MNHVTCNTKHRT